MLFERQGRVAYWGWQEFVLGAGEQAVKGYAACFDVVANVVVMGRSAENLITIGTFAETLLGDGVRRVNVELFAELRSRWFINDTLAPVLSTDLWQPCFLADGQTVSMDGTGRSMLGRVLAVQGASVLVLPLSLSTPAPSSSSGGVPTQSNKRMTALTTAGDGDPACATAITETPAPSSYVSVLVNGVEVSDLGNGTRVAAACYFSGDGGTTARAWSSIVAGDVLYWQGTIAGYELAPTDEIDFQYEAAS